MKFIIATLITLATSLANAETATDGWKWGVSFDSVANMKSAVTLDVLTPKLFGEYNEYSLVLSVSSQTLNYNLLVDDLNVVPVRLLFEARNPVYKDIVSSYVRLGVGWSFASDKVIHKDDGYLIVPVVLGVDLLAAERNGSYMSAFVQASFDSNFEAASDGLVNDLDGTIVSVGFRVFY